MVPLQCERPGPDLLAEVRATTTFWCSVGLIVAVAGLTATWVADGKTVSVVGGAIMIALAAYVALAISRGRTHRLGGLMFFPALGFLINSVVVHGAVGMAWSYPAVVSFYFLARERTAWIANAALIMIMTPVAVSVLPPAEAARSVFVLVVISAFSVISMRVVGAQHRLLRDMAITDSLTGLLNRCLLEPSLEQMLNRHHRTGESASLVLFDIDQFKGINDSFGHQAGDDVLSRIAELLRNRLRDSDQIFRIGGEEFVALLPGTDQDAATEVAQEIRSSIAEERFSDLILATVSGGVASIEAGDTPESILARADQRLYAAKRAGRNCVLASSPTGVDMAPIPSRLIPSNPE